MRTSYIPPEDQKDPLAVYAVNLPPLATERKLDPIIDRDDEIRRLIQILSRRRKNNPDLLGDPGVKKQWLTARFSSLMKKHLATAGFDQTFGARPSKRLTEAFILDEVAVFLIEQKVKAGDKLNVDYKKSKLAVEVKD